MNRIIGIDVGTSSSVAAAMVGGVPVIIPSAEGERLFPSAVAIEARSGEMLVGKAAWRQSVVHPGTTLFAVNRLIGHRFSDPHIQRYLPRLPYQVIQGPLNECRLSMGNKSYKPQEIIGMMLHKIRRDAEAYLGAQVSQAVLTAPAHFNARQRQALKDAGRLAGIETLEIIAQSIAVSLAYGLDRTIDETIAVYNLGSGTFEVSILDVGQGVFEVKSTESDLFVGGDDFDWRVIRYVADEFVKEHGIDLCQDRQALVRLMEAAEQARRELSTVTEIEINLPFIAADATGPKHLRMVLTRTELEQLTDDLIARTIGLCRRALEDARLSTSDVDQVVLVGGLARMLAVQQSIRQFFGREPYKRVNPDEAAGIGAAIQAGVLEGSVKDILLLAATPLTLSVETSGGMATPIIERNTTLPYRKSQLFSTTRDMQTSVEIHITEGERPLAADNESLYSLVLDGIPPAPRGVSHIEVTFDLDANQILHVSVEDKTTGRIKKATLTVSADPATPHSSDPDRAIQSCDDSGREHKNRTSAYRVTD